MTSQSFFLRNTNEDISIVDNISKFTLFAFKIGNLSYFSFGLIHTFFSTFIDGSL